jgi:hypothetical protein
MQSDFRRIKTLTIKSTNYITYHCHITKLMTKLLQHSYFELYSRAKFIKV